MKRIVLALTLAIIWTSPAFAEDAPPTAGGGVGHDSFFVGIIAPGRAGSGGGEGTAGDGPRPYRYTWVPAGPIAGQSPACDAGGGAPGWLHALVVRDLSGAIVSTEPRCVPLEPDGSIGAPPTLPPVPAVGEIWRAALRQIDAPRVGISPVPLGLTGLETWLWYDGPQELAVSASIGPWTVTGTARLAEVTFDPGDGQTVTAGTPGSATAPAARHVYETKGAYRIALTARWTADFVLSGPGLPARPTPMGSAVLRASLDYQVQEIRGLLVPDP